MGWEVLCIFKTLVNLLKMKGYKEVSQYLPHAAVRGVNC
ncbi:hypothetical protein SBF1_2550009 [Candidatus Desulfosporosinus infrequens]|uniref:Uncharacterized protein n=1 Tax=Candidatus Desulfosporosinus infrequens TaxID=2043169 RepID=A0A2U3KPH5_9FIRM|nr:hypothetical protein SBF1_2550009 [Candidatus Desulfosporosinus infrequens]